MGMQRCFPQQRPQRRPDTGDSVLIGAGAFTLIELLVVIAIIIVLTGLVILPMTNINSAGDLTKTTADIAGVLEEARAYAMANNTYVWVGIAESDATVDASKTQTQPGTGRVAVAVAASKDGTRGYDVSAPSLSSSNLVAISQLRHFENAHLGALNTTSSAAASAGGMRRPVISDNQYIITGTSTSATNFAWPLTGTPQYQFGAVINFDPSGVARIQTAGNRDNIGQYLEIGLQQAHGNVVATGSNVAAIQIDCMNGATRIYRP